MYLFEHDGKVYSPEGEVDIDPKSVAEINKEREREELQYIATAPDCMLLYFEDTKEGPRVITWLGTEVGKAEVVSSWPHKGWLSNRLYAIRATVAGREYHGRTQGNGTCVRLYATKN